MKFNKLSQLALVSTTGLLAATLFTACQIVTVDYLFLASPAGISTGSADGQVQVFAVDSESGALRAAAVPVSSGGSSPVAMAVTSNYENLYVANQASSSVVHFAIASNGVLTQKDAVALSAQGSTPVSIAVNKAGSYLYVVSAAHPGSSGTAQGAVLAAFTLSSDGTIGSAVSNGGLSYFPLVVPGYEGDLMVPTGVTVLANNAAVFVTAYDQSAYNPGGGTTSNANPGWVFGFGVGSGGSLTASTGSPYQAGVKPTSLAADPTNRFVYVTDYASNQLIGYTIQSGTTLDFLINGPFRTGNEPSAIVVDPRGKYIYIANSLDSSVSAYAIDLATGTPSAAVNVTGSSTNTTDTQPVSILVDPALGRFVYTGNHLGNSVSGFRLDPNTGTLAPTQATPYPSSASPTAVVSVPHGSHAIQVVNP